MGTNVSRFTLRAVKGVRRDTRGDQADRIAKNLAIGFAWFASNANRAHIALDQLIWSRFPYSCSYCTACPCNCDPHYDYLSTTPPITRPRTIEEWQTMFETIYPPGRRTKEVAAIHLAEEVGEFG